MKINRIKNKIRSMIGLLTIMFFNANVAMATKLENSRAITGTKELLQDGSKVLLILAPLSGACFIGYYYMRRQGADETDDKKWTNKIKIAIGATVGVVLASGMLNVLISYYK